MQKKLILDSELFDITVSRLCHQIIENYDCIEDTVILGLQPRGAFLSEILSEKLFKLTKKKPLTGLLDSTFHRDDFRRREKPVKASTTNIPFIIEDKNVILVDDVLFTGRSVRASLDAMITFGRPRKVELLVLINRKFKRELPVEPHYIGKNVHTLESQKVLVEWKEQGFKKNSVWLVNT
ncbi:MAG: bifunctional pyr operon transcriptional regulator/uracil phosphoribosyltransferase PyrR [Cyclobacteriaceae bacterium]|nr:bifunctional pyr operon transcriptional regulator/uracil phosphoribosyltransferase PyrR [Cyclobacteriaceae bacterium]